MNLWIHYNSRRYFIVLVYFSFLYINAHFNKQTKYLEYLWIKNNFSILNYFFPCNILLKIYFLNIKTLKFNLIMIKSGSGHGYFTNNHLEYYVRRHFIYLFFFFIVFAFLKTFLLYKFIGGLWGSRKNILQNN